MRSRFLLLLFNQIWRHISKIGICPTTFDDIFQKLAFVRRHLTFVRRHSTTYFKNWHLSDDIRRHISKIGICPTTFDDIFQKLAFVRRHLAFVRRHSTTYFKKEMDLIGFILTHLFIFILNSKIFVFKGFNHGKFRLNFEIYQSRIIYLTQFRHLWYRTSTVKLFNQIWRHISKIAICPTTFGFCPTTFGICPTTFDDIFQKLAFVRRHLATYFKNWHLSDDIWHLSDDIRRHISKIGIF
jgi:hypothetical protein